MIVDTTRMDPLNTRKTVPQSLFLKTLSSTNMENLFNIFLKHTPGTVAMLDRNMRYVAYSRRYLEDFSLDEEDLIGRHHYDVFPDLPQRWKTEHQECLNGREIPYREEPFERADGTIEWIGRKLCPWSLDNGDIGGILIFAEVLTSQKSAEEQLRDSEERCALLLDNATEAIIITQDGLIKFVNPLAETIFSYSQAEITHKPLTQFLHPDDRDRVSQVHALRQKGEVIEKDYSFRVVDSNQDVHWLETSTVSIFWKKRPAVLGFVKDVTYTKKLEEQLMRSQKLEAIGTLAGGITHDFNNILFPLIGYTEMLKEDVPSENPLTVYIDEILQAALRARDLVKQILSFSRQGDQGMSPIRLQPIVKEALKLLRASIPTTIDIQQEIDYGCGKVNADPTQIHQMVMNLATNAYHAMEKTGGTLTVGLKQVHLDVDRVIFPGLPPGEYALLVVADTGSGIETGAMDRIFDPYFTTKDKEKGTGLGLSVVQGIVKSCNGDIRAYSDPGMGTQMQVYLPVIRETGDPEIAYEAHPIKGGTERILLVDDEVSIIRMAQETLARLGYRVTTQPGGVEAFETFNANPDSFDLVVTDMTMPNMTGLELYRKIKQIRPNIPVIICTGFSDQIDDEKSRALGIDALISKPLIKREIAETIRKAIDKPAAI